jgi:hypothetical protein
MPTMKMEAKSSFEILALCTELQDVGKYNLHYALIYVLSGNKARVNSQTNEPTCTWQTQQQMPEIRPE